MAAMREFIYDPPEIAERLRHLRLKILVPRGSRSRIGFCDTNLGDRVRARIVLSTAEAS
jgi:hypothetical protein